MKNSTFYFLLSIFCTILLSTFYFLFSGLHFVSAAELYLETSENQYYTNETFIADIRLNVTPPESINAIEAYLEFPNNILKVIDFSTGNSILTFIKQPEINQEQGIVSFTGIIPGGYSGQLIGDPGKSNLLGRIIFSAVSQGSAQIVFQGNSQVLLSDGKGTPAKLISKGVIFEIVAKPFDYAQGKDEWQEELEKDKTPPEEFKPEIVKINDKYFLVFNTQDKQSGIAYYAIRETTRRKHELTRIDNITRIDTKKWVEAESPYVLRDQKLRSFIYVKAMDKAGNERVAVVEPRYPMKWYEFWQIWFIIILVISLVITKGLWKKLLIHK